MRNVGIVHDSDTSAYDTPNRNVDHSSRPSLARAGFGIGRFTVRPMRNQMPSTIRPRPKHECHPRQPLLDRVEAPLQRDADDSEHDEEADGDRQADRQRAQHARPLVGMRRSFETEEVRQVGRQHGEAARIEGGHHAHPERVGERRVDHACRSSRMIVSRSDCESRPVCTLTMVPFASTNSVVGMFNRSIAVAIWPCLSNRMS